jgi:hypothetical protein
MIPSMFSIETFSSNTSSNNSSVKEFIDKCFISLDPYTFKDIVANPQNYRHTIDEAKILLEDFSESKVLNRIKICLKDI